MKACHVNRLLSSECGPKQGTKEQFLLGLHIELGIVPLVLLLSHEKLSERKLLSQVMKFCLHWHSRTSELPTSELCTVQSSKPLLMSERRSETPSGVYKFELVRYMCIYIYVWRYVCHISSACHAYVMWAEIGHIFYTCQQF